MFAVAGAVAIGFVLYVGVVHEGRKKSIFL